MLAERHSSTIKIGDQQGKAMNTHNASTMNAQRHQNVRRQRASFSEAMLETSSSHASVINRRQELSRSTSLYPTTRSFLDRGQRDSRTAYGSPRYQPMDLSTTGPLYSSCDAPSPIMHNPSRHESPHGYGRGFRRMDSHRQVASGFQRSPDRKQRFVVERTNNERDENDGDGDSFSILQALEDLEDRVDDDDKEEEEEEEPCALKAPPYPQPENYASQGNLIPVLPLGSESLARSSSHRPQQSGTASKQGEISHNHGGGTQMDEDMLLAMALQQEEDEYAAALRQDRDRREEEQRQLVMQLLSQIPDAPPSQQPVDKDEVLEYVAPETLDVDEQSDFTLVNDSSWATEKDICAICHESLSTGLVVSLRNCNHLFHMDCLDDAMEHSKRCPKCRKDIRSPLTGVAPSGRMCITRPVINGYTDKRVIQIEYIIPDGEQKYYHDFPGDPYKGTIKIAYLPANSQGTYLLKRLKFAFLNGLTFRVAQTNGTEKCVVNWASIPHRFSLSEKEFDATYMAACNEALDQLGVPTSFDK